MYPMIYSMHVTKTFATGEAGLVYCADGETIALLRCMGNFGFGKPRTATLPGLNGKLTEIGALLAREKLKNFSALVEQRQELADAYRRELPELSFQVMKGPRHAYQFMPALLPGGHHQSREYVITQLAAAGVSAGTYFSPHLAEQPYFMQNSEFLDLKATQDVCARIISLPMYDSMTHRDVQIISEHLRTVLAS
jgi:dTDP-4-amino-4,6-dideoxygalactose transaminase